MTSFAVYLEKIQASLARGDATEHTHRPALKELLESAAKNIVATNEPKHIPLIGAPDFKVSRGKIPLGHLETKPVGTDLAEMRRGKGAYGDQFLRYSALPNWVLTDYLEFHWFVNGKHQRTVRLAALDKNKKLNPLPNAADELADQIGRASCRERV